MKGSEHECLPELTKKDMRDIQRKFDTEKKRLEEDKDFYTEDVETQKLFLASFYDSLCLAKRLSKKKFTPNKKV
ncbi:immunity repressor protein [Desertibacillus haloalkaliphilus]|uniref:immunity repressor protein n=1 Tax=Desertibacillus haloalkaliphilus TaxID=1328930 RepID=UPI001C26E1F1|nr:immunity repressor protein [Desertibacillus haloalkaliphilus]MBU8908475.1 immunity repressor protein [Desertibacillus haloalkaliphilus]